MWNFFEYNDCNIQKPIWILSSHLGQCPCEHHFGDIRNLIGSDRQTSSRVESATKTLDLKNRLKINAREKSKTNSKRNCMSIEQSVDRSTEITNTIITYFNILFKTRSITHYLLIIL